jgi:hypothetical protein
VTVLYKLLNDKDIPRCVAGIAMHPVLGPRYGNLIERLPSAIRNSLGLEAFKGIIFEESQGSKITCLGAGLAVFVTDDFIQELKATPFFWLGPELVKRITRGSSPLQSDLQVRDANSTTGLNVVVWHNSVHPVDLRRVEVGTRIMAAFEEQHRGYRIREVIGQADCLEHFEAMCNAGGLGFDRLKNQYTEVSAGSVQDLGEEPRNVGGAREIAFRIGGSWLWSLFLYERPVFCFSRSEQRLLRSALEGGTDSDLSDELGVSLFAIKKMWRAIYDRVAACHPGLVPGNSPADAWVQDRGKQKKQRLLPYVRKHPEELRPVSRKLLNQQRASRRPSSESKRAFRVDA